MKEVIRDLPFARNLSSLTNKLKARLNTDSTELENLYQALPATQTIPGSSQRIIAALQNLRNKFIEAAPGGGFQPIKGSENVVAAYDDMIRQFQGGDRLVQNLRQRRQAWDELVNWWRKDIARQPASESVYENVANLVRGEINQHFPDIAKKNARVAAWKDLVDIANESEPAAWLGGKRMPPSAAGAGVEIAAGRTPSPYAVAHAVSYGSGPFKTMWRTFSAPQKARIAGLLQNGMVQEAVREMSRIGGAEMQEWLTDPTASRGDILAMFGRDPTRPLAPPVSKGPSGTASARIAPPPAPPAGGVTPSGQVLRKPRAPNPMPPAAFNPTTVAGATGGAQPQTTATPEDLNRKVEVIGPMGPGLISAGAFDPRKYKLVHPELDEQFLPAGGPFTADDFFRAPRRP